MEWRPPESASDIARLNKLVEYYESVNLDQIQQITNMKQTQEANSKTMLEYEKNKKLLTKTVKSLEGRMKFDKIAADGMKKKFNLLEYEVREIKHTNEHMRTERDEDKTMIAQLKDDLNSNRSDKLKFMHENAVLKKQAATLTLSETNANADVVYARSDLLHKLQALDNTIAQNDTLKRTIAAQSEEMLTLSHEQHDLNEKLFAANKQVVNLELMTAEHNRTIDILQHEISRLRKELASSSHSFNVKSSALLTRGGGANPSNRVSTDITHSSYGQEGDGPYALSRRPHTQQGLSRERNQLASSGTTPRASRSQPRRSLGDSSQLYEEKLHHTIDFPLSSNLENALLSRKDQPEYQYVDLSAHLQRPSSKSNSAVLVAGGSIGTNGDSLDTTVRTFLLQDYSDVLGAAQVGLSLRAATAKGSAVDRGSIDGIKSVTNSGSAMCSPVSTPFRRPPSQTSPLKPLTSHSSQYHQDPTAWFQQQRPQSKGSNALHLNESLVNIKKCYSMPVSVNKNGGSIAETLGRVATAQGRQEGNQAHQLRETILNKTNANDDPDASVTFVVAGGPASVASTPISPGRVGFLPQDSLVAKTDEYHRTKPNENRAKMKSLPADSNNKKSIFVGAGLGLKHNLALDAELKNLNKGSTHQILKKILGDRFD